MQATNYQPFSTKAFLADYSGEEENYPITDRDFYEKHGEITQVVMTKLPTDRITADNPQISAVAVNSINILNLLNSWPENRVKPKSLVKTACVAYGQLAYLSPNSLTKYDKAFIPLLKSGEITYRNLDTFYWQFKFGPLVSRTSLDPSVVKINLSGFYHIEKYKLNYPIYFNRLLGEFTGQNLLIGGGSNCECGNASERHPKENWYSVDIDITPQSDVVMHAGYESHITFFPFARFQTIWFEHAEVAGELFLPQIFKYYFRMLKYGGVLFYQSTFHLPGLEDTGKKGVEDLADLCKNFCMPILELKDRRRDGKIYTQLIAMKPYLKQEGDCEEISEYPSAEINQNQYRFLNEAEQWRALVQAKLETKQERLLFSDFLRDHLAKNKGIAAQSGESKLQDYK